MSLQAWSMMLGGDFGVYQTVSQLISLVNQSLRDPSAKIRLRAESLLFNTGERDEEAEITSIFTFVENALHYVDDPADIELLKNPSYIDDRITETGFFMGDCDDASGYLAALLKSVGYPVQFVIVTPQGASDFDYHHIYVRVWMNKGPNGVGHWLGLDATAKSYPMGWEVPNQKERVYNV